MSKTLLVVLGVVVLGGALWLAKREAGAPARARGVASGSEATSASHVRGPDAASTSDQEIEALRSQVRERDKMLGALMVQAAAYDRTAEKKVDLTVSVSSRLDERLFAGVLNGPQVTQLEAAAESALRGLPSAVKATVACSTELCRITVQGAAKDIDGQCGHVLERMPKTFASSLVVPEAEGQCAVFAATRQELLALHDGSASASDSDMKAEPEP